MEEDRHCCYALKMCSLIIPYSELYDGVLGRLHGGCIILSTVLSIACHPCQLREPDIRHAHKGNT